MANLYKQYMRLLDKWPVNKNRKNDLGQFIRDQVKLAFIKGENSKIEDKVKCQKDFESLDRLASNYYYKKYPTNLKRTASGLKLEVCNAVLDDDFQELIERQKLGFFAKLKLSIKNLFSKGSEEQK